MEMINYDYEEREDKLPKWVQDKLDHYRRRVSALEASLNIERQTGITEGEPNVGIGMRTDKNMGSPEKLYPEGTRVTFSLKNGDRLREQIRAYALNGVLSIQGGDVLKIKPIASNCIELQLDSNL